MQSVSNIPKLQSILFDHLFPEDVKELAHYRTKKIVLKDADARKDLSNYIFIIRCLF